MVTKKNWYKSKHLTNIIIAIICIIILSFIIVLFLNKKNSNTTTDKPSTTSRDPVTNINLSPPTESDKIQADQNKEELSKNQSSSNTSQINSSSNGNKKSVSPIITFFDYVGDNVQISSYVNGVFEDGGTCIATFSKDTTTFSKSSTGSANASNTSCHNIDVAKSDFATKGVWKLVIRYTSSTSEGTSEPKILEIK